MACPLFVVVNATAPVVGWAFGVELELAKPPVPYVAAVAVGGVARGGAGLVWGAARDGRAGCPSMVISSVPIVTVLLAISTIYSQVSRPILLILLVISTSLYKGLGRQSKYTERASDVGLSSYRPNVSTRLTNWYPFSIGPRYRLLNCFSC